MGKLKVDGETYRLEEFSYPSEVNGRMQSTFLISDKRCFMFLKKMAETKKIKKFKAKCQRGIIKGTFQVLDVYGSRVCIVRFFKYKFSERTVFR